MTVIFRLCIALLKGRVFAAPRAFSGERFPGAMVGHVLDVKLHISTAIRAGFNDRLIGWPARLHCTSIGGISALGKGAT